VENKDGEMVKGLNAMYRWYLQDPIRFRRSVRMSIEHGHANDFANDYSSVAYWYQKEPHAGFPALPPSQRRRPVFEDAYYRWLNEYGRLCHCLIDFQDRTIFKNQAPPGWVGKVREKTLKGYYAFIQDKHGEAEKLWQEALGITESNGYKLPPGE
jgi:hypothetical protein